MKLELVRTPTVGKKYICPYCHSAVLYNEEREHPSHDGCNSEILVFQLHLEIVEGE